jgi:hypothetical protein
MKDFHGEGEWWRFEVSNLWTWEKALGYETYDFWSFVQGIDEEDLRKLLQLHLQYVSISLIVLINILLGLFPYNLCLFTYVCIIDVFDWNNIIE